MHSYKESGLVLTRSYLFINFLRLRTEVWEFEALLKCLRKRNRVSVSSEIGNQILDQV